jgi:hypothetical protein
MKAKLNPLQQKVKNLQQEYKFSDEKRYKAINFTIELLEAQIDYFQKYKPTIKKEYIEQLRRARETICELEW